MNTAAIYSDQIQFENPQRYPWQDSSLCAQVSAELFFPSKGGTYTEAKKICDSCLVRTNCLEKALMDEKGLITRERFGMFGGLTPRQRVIAEKKRNKENIPDNSSGAQIAA